MLPTEVSGGVESCAVVVPGTREMEETSALVLVGANAEETPETSDEGIGVKCAAGSEEFIPGGVLLIEVGEERRVLVLSCVEVIEGPSVPVPVSVAAGR